MTHHQRPDHRVPGVRASLPISDELLHALHQARVVYLLPWQDEQPPHRLIITALTVDQTGFVPTNYATRRAVLIIPPGARHLLPPTP